MKNSYYFIIVLLFFISINLNALKINNKVLEMTGVVKQNLYFQQKTEVYVVGAKLNVYNEKNDLIGTFYSNNLGKCNFSIPINNIYSIIISKEKYISKKIDVNTQLPINKESNYRLQFDVYMFEELKDVDVSLLDDPIAKIEFNRFKKYFFYDILYTDAVNNFIRKKYAEFYMLDLRNKLRDHSYFDSNVMIEPTLIDITITDSKDSKVIDDKIEFQIQLVAFLNQQLALNSELFLFCGDVRETFSDGMFKYTTGHYESLNLAHEKLNEFVAMGFSESFVIAKKGVKQISITDALIILNK